MRRRLQQIQTSIQDHSGQIDELQARSARRQQDLQDVVHRQSSSVGTTQQDELLRPLKQELRHRLQQAEGLEASLGHTQGELQAADQRLQVELLPALSWRRRAKPVLGALVQNFISGSKSTVVQSF